MTNIVIVMPKIRCIYQRPFPGMTTGNPQAFAEVRLQIPSTQKQYFSTKAMINCPSPRVPEGYIKKPYFLSNRCFR